MDDLSPYRDAVIGRLAQLLDVPEEILHIPPLATPHERAALEAQSLRELDAACADAARVLGPRLLWGAGLDPERYELRWEAWRDE